MAAVRGGDWRSTLSFNLSLKLILRTNDREDNNSWARHDPTVDWGLVGYHQADCGYLIYHLLGKARQGNLDK